ncbi:MAG TPA: glycerol kinase GlpK [Ktedonobacteraceae bacterium]|nr:glycerol kinase GlpK [Ktedonobacteraceae bacterium]
MLPAILAIDQGTTRTKALIFDANASPLAESSSEIPLTYPHPGWVEQNPGDLLQSVVENARAVLATTEAEIIAFGLSNQGETVVMWDACTGQPLYNAISWQDRRTGEFCDQLAHSVAGRLISERTGLPIDPYFSATKLRWLLDNVPEARSLASKGELLAGTTDSWLLWNLSGEHLTDDTTASRTMLYNPRIRDWDQDILDVLDIPRSILPAIRPSCSLFGTVRSHLIGRPMPVTASLVDQQAALFGQACFEPNDVKVTYGTGAFILLNTGHEIPTSHYGLVPTVAWSFKDSISYALDGGIYVAGAAVQWLRDGLGIISSAEETLEIARSVPDSGGVFFVPALAGLAAPYWDSHARGTIVGLTRGTTRAHLVRAALEGIAFRTRDVLEAMAQDSGHPIRSIKVDGGASANAFLMQSLADISGVEVRVAAIRETTSLGAAFLAGLGIGLWEDQAQLSALWREAASYSPHRDANIELQYQQWQRAVERARGWAMPLSRDE